MLRSRRRLVWLITGLVSLTALVASGVAAAAGRASAVMPSGSATSSPAIGSAVTRYRTPVSDTYPTPHGYVTEVSAKPVSISPTRDCTIASAAPKTAECRSTSGFDFAGNSGATLYRTLLDFSELRAALPAHARVLSARLSLSVIGVDGAPAIAAYALTKPFVQKQVTWDSASRGHRWLAAGGDAPSMSRRLGFAGFVKPTKPGIYSIPLTALTRSWLDGATPNDGVLLRSYNETRRAYDAFSSYSGAQSPLLEIDWVPQSSPPS